MLRNTGTKYFLDSNVIIMAILRPDEIEGRIVFSFPATKFTNNYVIKEIRRVMLNKKIPQNEIEAEVTEVKRHVIVLSTPPKHEFQKLEITDKSNKPIVCSALKAGCVFISNDVKTRNDAKKYVKAQTPEEVFQ